MPADKLFSIQAVTLKTPVDKIISRPGVKAICENCGEEIMNEREVICDGTVLCKACAEGAYYDPALANPMKVSLVRWESARD
jgi:formylmethanofuran dehydrogenase subunit E